MDTRPYLDKLVTSPHIPRQPGQVGYCSRTLIPDLSCAGIHSDLEPKRDPVTTADGKMTKTFVMNAYRTMREIQRGVVVLNSKEEVFKVGHKQYIDKLLVSMESEKRDRHERRMRHFKTKKDGLGFEGSFDSAFGVNSGTWEPVSAKGAQGGSEFGDCTPQPDSRYGLRNPAEDNSDRTHPAPLDYDAARQDVSSRGNHSVRFREDSPYGFPSPPKTSDSGSTAGLPRENTTSSRMSAFSTKSGASGSGSGGGGASVSGFTARTDAVKRAKTHSRLALFKTLLNDVEPPPSPVKRFGSLQGSSDVFSAETLAFIRSKASVDNP